MFEAVVGAGGGALCGIFRNNFGTTDWDRIPELTCLIGDGNVVGSGEFKLDGRSGLYSSALLAEKLFRKWLRML